MLSKRGEYLIIALIVAIALGLNALFIKGAYDSAGKRPTRAEVSQQFVKEQVAVADQIAKAVGEGAVAEAVTQVTDIVTRNGGKIESIGETPGKVVTPDAKRKGVIHVYITAKYLIYVGTAAQQSQTTKLDVTMSKSVYQVVNIVPVA